MISIKVSILEIESDLRKKIEIICSFNNLLTNAIKYMMIHMV